MASYAERRKRHGGGYISIPPVTREKRDRKKKRGRRRGNGRAVKKGRKKAKERRPALLREALIAPMDASSGHQTCLSRMFASRELSMLDGRELFKMRSLIVSKV